MFKINALNLINMLNELLQKFQKEFMQFKEADFAEKEMMLDCIDNYNN